MNCSGLVSVTFAEYSKPEEIGALAFYNCTSLKEIEIPDGTVTIRDRAFSGCTLLQIVVIPQSVQRIRNYAFENCSAAVLYCQADVKPSVRYPEWNVSECPVVWVYDG